MRGTDVISVVKMDAVLVVGVLPAVLEDGAVVGSLTAKTGEVAGSLGTTSLSRS